MKTQRVELVSPSSGLNVVVEMSEQGCRLEWYGNNLQLSREETEDLHKVLNGWLGEPVSVWTSESAEALRKAVPLMVLLGDYIGNDYGRCEAILQARQALRKLGLTEHPREPGDRKPWGRLCSDCDGTGRVP